MQPASRPIWRRARGCETGQCVEVANHDGQVLVRDSKDPNTVLAFDNQTWAAFLDGILSSGFIEVRP